VPSGPTESGVGLESQTYVYSGRIPRRESPAMPPRFLFGPTTAAFADSRLGELRRAGICLAFGPGGVDLSVGSDASWDEIAARFPDGWSPDLVALWLNYTAVPSGLWSAPVPLVGLATDWNLLWHELRHLLPHCDAVLADAPGVEALARAGIDHARPAILYGVAPDALVESPAAERDIDILFVGNLHPAVQRERLPWLARLARLADRWNVAIRTGIPGAECRGLLARARIAFNRSVRSEANMRAFEAAAAGALLFQEAGNRELPAVFADRRECVYYRDDDLEALLEHYLSHEDERRAIAEAARAKVASYSFPALLVRGLEGLWESEGAGLVEQARERMSVNSGAAGLSLAARVWMKLGDAGPEGDDRLEADLLEAAEVGGGGSAAAWHALGVLARHPGASVEAFRRAVAAGPGQVVSGLALALALAASGRRDNAIEQARRVLEGLERCAPSEEFGSGDGAPSYKDGLPSGHGSTHSGTPAVPTTWDLPTYPAEFDDLRVGWERAAWLNAGDPAGEVEAKRALVRWRLHALLADLTDDLAHFEAAAAARSDLPTACAALGCALARAGRLAEALPHLRRAVADQPFDLAAARALCQVLVDLGLSEEQHALVRERRRLARAAPQVVRPEPWFEPSAHRAPVADHTPAAGMGTTVLTMGRAEFAARFGAPDTARALCGYTVAADTHAVLTILAHARPRRVLEVGTALGHMTANLTEWTPDDAHVFSLGIVCGMANGGAPEQGYEAPDRADFGRLADHFGKAHKAYFIVADSRHYDFGRLAPLDFVFLDGGHDLEHALSDTRRAYDALGPGGWLVWHDFDSPMPWVRVREAIDRLGLPDLVLHVAGTQVAFLRKQAPLPAPRGQRPPKRPVRLMWEGDQQGLHSLALVNRAFCRELLERGHDLGLLVGSEEIGVWTPDRLPADPRLSARFDRGPAGGPAQVHVRHHWPPRLDPPPEGRWVFMQPWEFGRLPRDWLPALRRVDEVWAYSRSVRACYVDSGVDPGRVHVVPLGVDPVVFRPGVEPMPMPPGPGFRFLFVGGTIHRKGFDLLLSAYARAFRPTDGVGLVIKDMGTRSFYQGQTAGAAVAEVRADGYPIEYLDRALDEREMAGLYAACDCLAHPYRGEGFALPVVEAMACGRPAIVTAAGPALDYASEATAFLVPARRAEFRECRVGDIETIGRPWMWEPDLDALVEALHRAASDPTATRAKGAAASDWIRGRFTWSHAADAAEARLRALVE
jgi:glycosyltransferase involved in cell wall biosynthesis/tetratricopeptide (TPR) repeat protein